MECDGRSEGQDACLMVYCLESVMDLAPYSMVQNLRARKNKDPMTNLFVPRAYIRPRHFRQIIAIQNIFKGTDSYMTKKDLKILYLAR